MKLDLSNFSDLLRSQKWKWQADKKKKKEMLDVSGNTNDQVDVVYCTALRKCY